MIKEKEEVLTARQVADELHRHINTIWGYLQTGKLKGSKLAGYEGGIKGRGKKWLIKREDLEEFIKAGRNS